MNERLLVARHCAAGSVGVWVCARWGKQGDEKLSLSSSGSQAGERHRAFIMISAGGEFEGPSKGNQ